MVIAAYNEAGGIGPVLTNMPRTCAGLPVDVLVVVDGATDDTAAVVPRARGFRVCCPEQPWSGRRTQAGLSPRRCGRGAVRRDDRCGRAVRQRRARRPAGADSARARRLRHRVAPARSRGRGQPAALGRGAGFRCPGVDSDPAEADRHVVRVPCDAGRAGDRGDVARAAVPVVGVVARGPCDRCAGGRAADDDAAAR